MTRLQRSVGEIDVPGELLRLAVDCLSDQAVWTLDPRGVIRSWNAGAEHLFGWDRSRAIGQQVGLVFPPEQGEPGLRVEDLRDADRTDRWSCYRWARPTNGTRRYVKITIVPRRLGAELVGYGAVALEVATQQGEDAGTSVAHTALAARMEETTRRLAESNALLATEIADRHHAEAARNRLLRRLVAGEEEERRRIARDLHDDLGQQLIALRLGLEASQRDGQAPGSLAGPLAMLARIDQDLDFLAWELRPAALDELGLVKVLDTYVSEWSRHAGVRATFHGRLRQGERIAPEIEASVYRIAQEALNNVAKHAHARSVNVLLEQRGDALLLIVEDDGVGLNPGTSETTIGLTGMRERVAAVGGTLELEPTPEGGTTVRTHIPIAATSSQLAASLHGPASDGRVTPAIAGGVSAPGSPDANGSVLNSARERLQELQQAVAARDEFIATVAHELRNPIAPLTFQLRLAIGKTEQIAAAGDTPSVEWVLSQLRRIEQRLHRLLETLERLLDVSRLSMGSIDLQPELMDIAGAARDVTNSLEAELGVARSKLTFVERRAATGYWDRVRVEQICRNLLSNAIRYGAGRPIEVEVDADHDVATLQVRDYGIGIAADQQTRIFERFERGVEQRSGGFGIGLWVVKTICVAMGGTIAVQSELGEGARFTVTLPRRVPRPSLDNASE